MATPYYPHLQRPPSKQPSIGSLAELAPRGRNAVSQPSVTRRRSQSTPRRRSRSTVRHVDAPTQPSTGYPARASAERPRSVPARARPAVGHEDLVPIRSSPRRPATPSQNHRSTTHGSRKPPTAPPSGHAARARSRDSRRVAQIVKVSDGLGAIQTGTSIFGSALDYGETFADLPEKLIELVDELDRSERTLDGLDQYRDADRVLGEAIDELAREVDRTDDFLEKCDPEWWKRVLFAMSLSRNYADRTKRLEIRRKDAIDLYKALVQTSAPAHTVARERPIIYRP